MFDRMDWNLLWQQKKTLIGVIDLMRDMDREAGFERSEAAEHLEGLLNLIDEVQDHAVEEIGVPHEAVYWYLTPEHRAAEGIEE